MLATRWTQVELDETPAELVEATIALLNERAEAYAQPGQQGLHEGFR